MQYTLPCQAQLYSVAVPAHSCLSRMLWVITETTSNKLHCSYVCPRSFIGRLIVVCVGWNRHSCSSIFRVKRSTQRRANAIMLQEGLFVIHLVDIEWHNMTGVPWLDRCAMTYKCTMAWQVCQVSWTDS